MREVERENRHDLLLLLPACAWQVSLFLAMAGIVLKKWDAAAGCGAPMLLVSAFPYCYWFKNLKTFLQSSVEAEVR